MLIETNRTLLNESHNGESLANALLNENVGSKEFNHAMLKEIFIESELARSIKEHTYSEFMEQTLIDHGQHVPIEEFRSEILESLIAEIDNIDVDKFNSQKVLEEAVYFGKTPDLLKAEALLDEVIASYHSLKTLSFVDITNKMAEVEEILRDKFNYRGLALNISGLVSMPSKEVVLDDDGRGTMITNADGKKELKTKFTPVSIIGLCMFTVPNAFTFATDPLSTIRNSIHFDPMDYLEVKDKSIKWKDDLVKPYSTVNVTAGLLQTNEITGAEVLAIILHEIGHNFYNGSVANRAFKLMSSAFSSIAHVLTAVSLWIERSIAKNAKDSAIGKGIADMFYKIYFTIITSMSSVFSLRVSKTVLNTLSPKLRKYIESGENLVHSAVNYVNSVVSVVDIIIKIPTLGIGYLYDVLTTKLPRMLSYVGLDGLGEEKFADQFAAAHGYASELISGLNKFTGVYSREKLLADRQKNTAITIMGILTTSYTYSNAFFTLFDPHPDDIVRPVYITEFLKEQLKTEKNPEKRKMLQKDIAESYENFSEFAFSLKSGEAMVKYGKCKSEAEAIKKSPILFAGIREFLTVNKYSLSSLDKSVLDKAVAQ